MKPKYDLIRQNYEYNLHRLEEHLKLVETSYLVSDLISKLKFLFPTISAVTTASGFFTVNKFRNTLKTSKNIVYEQALISLLTSLEIYVSDLLRWIYQSDYESASNLKVNLPLNEINQDFQSLLEKVIDNHMNRLSTWRKKVSALASTRLSLDLNKVDIYQHKIKEMIARRNIIIHNQGIINEQYFAEISNHSAGKNLKLGNYIVTDKEYFGIAKTNSAELVTLIDAEIKKTYGRLEEKA